MVITTGSDIKAIGDFTNEYSDAEISTEIDIVEAELYSKFKLPRRSGFVIDDDYTQFYISKEPVYDIIRVQVAVDTSINPGGYSIIATGSDTWEFTTGTNYITLDSDFINTYADKTVRVQYIPKIFNLLASNIAALNLIDPTIITDGDNAIDSPQITRIKDRILRYKMIIQPKTMFRSSSQADYDEDEYITITQSSFR